jgi:hypothetical protein
LQQARTTNRTQIDFCYPLQHYPFRHLGWEAKVWL